MSYYYYIINCKLNAHYCTMLEKYISCISSPISSEIILDYYSHIHIPVLCLLLYLVYTTMLRGLVRDVILIWFTCWLVATCNARTTLDTSIHIIVDYNTVIRYTVLWYSVGSCGVNQSVRRGHWTLQSNFDGVSNVKIYCNAKVC